MWQNRHKDPPVLQLSVLRKQRTSAILFESRHSDYDHVLVVAVSVPMQTAILGHLSSDAIAANSVSSTFYQYLKVVVIALSSASAVMIGNSIGAGDLKRCGLMPAPVCH